MIYFLESGYILVRAWIFVPQSFLTLYQRSLCWWLPSLNSPSYWYCPHCWSNSTYIYGCEVENTTLFRSTWLNEAGNCGPHSKMVTQIILIHSCSTSSHSALCISSRQMAFMVPELPPNGAEVTWGALCGSVHRAALIHTCIVPGCVCMFVVWSLRQEQCECFAPK